MLSESAARLVESAAVLGEPQNEVHQGAPTLPARRLWHPVDRVNDPSTVGEPTLVGRTWRRTAVSGDARSSDRRSRMRDRRWSGPPGIGKSRVAGRGGVRSRRPRCRSLGSTYCESHTTRGPIPGAAHDSRSGFGVDDSTAQRPGHRVRAGSSRARPAEDVLLLDELGIGDPADDLPKSPPRRAAGG